MTTPASPHLPLGHDELAAVHERLLAWFEREARDLPWRGGVPAWHVMISELMLQQTPVARVLPVYLTWIERWPTPGDLAAEPVGEAVRAWGRLGYPRRALRLHAAAVAIVEHHGGVVPSEHDELLALPGVGAYTAAAIASFAFGQRHAVLDTNVRRVLARLVQGVEHPAPSVTAAERQLAVAAMPSHDADRWAAATMELGALVCRASAPACDDCPVRDACRWRRAGYPVHTGARRPSQAWDGTDRQCRGRLLAVLRETSEPVPKAALDLVWPDDVQRERCLDGLVADGLVEPLAGATFTLPR